LVFGPSSPRSPGGEVTGPKKKKGGCKFGKAVQTGGRRNGHPARG